MQLPGKTPDLLLADLLGTAVLALCVLVLALSVPRHPVPAATWFLLFLLLWVCGLFSWKHAHAPHSVKGWLLCAGIASGASWALFMFAKRWVPEAESARFHAQLLIYAGLAFSAALLAVSGLVRYIFLRTRGRLDASE